MTRASKRRSPSRTERRCRSPTSPSSNRDDTVAHPVTALLVVEVAVSSLRIDTAIKPALYAAAGVPELWVIDVPGHAVRVFADPRPEGYTTTRTVREGAITPSAVEAEPLDTAALLAGL